MVKYGVYIPPTPDLPHLAVVIGRKGQVVACEAVKSMSEGRELLRQIKENLPEFLDEIENRRH